MLAEFGGYEIAMMAGAMLGAAEAGMLLLIDGFIVGAAFLVAARIEPAIVDYGVLPPLGGARPSGAAQGLRRGAADRPRLRLGEGTGAALAWPLVRAAAAFLNEMASFESAGVAEKT